METLCFLVMPCLNEEKSLRETCESLGYGTGCGGQRRHHHLVIVDNGSSDGSVKVAEIIRDRSLAGTVHIVNESTRGFVPARSAGVTYVKKIVRDFRCQHSKCLVLQVDADAEYSKDYLSCFEEAALAHGPGNLFEAQSVMPNGASNADLSLLRKLNEFDERFFDKESSCEDFVVDDKVVGYFLSDWESIGGLMREYLDGREYIFCGTSRMWIRMRWQGFTRQMVSGASCVHSLRKLEEGADIFSASAGWPRGSIWREMWRSSVGYIPNSADLLSPREQVLWGKVLAERERHLMSLFVHLPAILMGDSRGTKRMTPLDGLVAAFDRGGIDLREDLL